MAVTFLGSATTPHIALSAGVMFTIANTFRSRCAIDLKRLVSQVDPTGPPSATAGHVMPMLRTRRCAAASISGGVLIPARAAWDTAVNAPDSGVEIRHSGGYFGAPLTVTLGDRLWQQFTSREASAAEQRRTEDFLQVPNLAAGGNSVQLLPGQALAIECVYGTQPTAGTAFFQLMWAEDQTDAGYTLGGKVTLAAANVAGARVHVLTAPAVDMVGAQVETLVTNGTGDYAQTLATGVKAAVFVQHESGGVQYTDEGKPFIEGP